MKRAATIAFAIATVFSSVTTVTAAPPAAITDSAWVQTNDEAGWALAAPAFGVPYKSTAATDAKPLEVGDVTVDGLYVFAGEGSGWEIRPMEYRYQGGRFVRVRDSAGRVIRIADSPVTTGERSAQTGRLGGN